MSEHKACIIVGAGAAGLIQAGELLKKNVFKCSDILILERQRSFGGVWAAATYPGAASISLVLSLSLYNTILKLTCTLFQT